MGISAEAPAEETVEEAPAATEAPTATEVPAVPAMSNMDRLFRTINISTIAGLAVLELILVICQVMGCKKRKKA